VRGAPVALGADVAIPAPATTLLRSAHVQKALGLDAQQQAALETALDQTDLPLWRLRDIEPAQRQAKARPLLDKFDAKLADVLTASQRARFNQLLLQTKGVVALLDTSVQAKLVLSPAQVTTIRTVLATAQQREAVLGHVDPATHAASVSRLHARAERTVMGVLTAPQRRAFETLRGEPFDFSAIRQVTCRAP
jgi:predicted amidohydrolase YtcJ